MSSESIRAYDVPERVASYDADMVLMHPNRHKMVQVALEILPFDANAAFTAVDLGIGTGFFTQAVLARFPNCRVTAIDGAASMVEMAKARLGAQAGRVQFRMGDFRNLAQLLAGERGELVYSSYALHHLTREEKVRLVQDAVAFLKPGGWFLNADLIVAESAQIEQRIQQVRVAEIVRRGGGRDERFLTAASTRQFLDDLQARDEDKPLSVFDDVRALREAGLETASVLWLEYREALTGGVKKQ